MTITSSASEIQYDGDGTSTAFTVPFPFDTSADLRVILTDSDGNPAVLSSGFSVAGGGGSTGTITMVAPPAVGEKLTVLDDPERTQPVDYTANDAFPAETHERALDRNTRLSKRLYQLFLNSLHYADGDPSHGTNAQLPTVAARRGKWAKWADDSTARLEPAELAAAGTALSQSIIAALLYPQLAAEASAGVTPSSYVPHTFAFATRYGADPTGVGDSSAAIQRAIDTGLDIVFPPGDYKAANLTQSVDRQRFIAIGNVRIIKNANGPIITASGDEIELNGIAFRGDASTPTFTGDNVVLTGDNPRLINCGSRWAQGYALRATGNGVKVYGTCDIYQTANATAGGYDILIGQSGVATLYHKIIGITTSQSTGGIVFVDTGSAAVSDSQFGKLYVQAGTLPSGVNGGNFHGNRITGTVNVEIPSAVFAGNTFGAVAITLAAGTSGHVVQGNAYQVGATITDNSTNSVVEDIRVIPPTTYTPSWTAASVNPSLGDGSAVGYVQKVGRRVKVSGRITMGSTTTFGTGVYTFSLPYVPSTSIPQIGVAFLADATGNNYVGMVQTLTDGTARCVIYVDNGGQLSPTVPFTWAQNDEIRFTIEYFV